MTQLRQWMTVPGVASALLLALLLTPPLAAQTDGGSDARLTDETIAEVVTSRLAKRQLGTQVSATVEDGVVTLTGTVDSLAEKHQAARLASKVDDVQRVDNELTLAPSPKSAAEIAQEISVAVDNYVLYSVFDWVEGRVEDGRVMLQGYVTEPWKKDDIAQRVTRIPGVRSVENSIRVLSPVDDDLRISLARRIYGDLMFVGRESGANPPIHIVVHDGGDVTLEGIVRTEVEKRVAGSLARNHPWTFEVENNLRVAGSRQASQ